MNMTEQRYRDAWLQCEKHMHHLLHAVQSVRPALPVTAAALSCMDDETVQDWDQFILRFTKLQDTMGSRLYPALLGYLQEPYEDRPMLDKLNRLEKLGLIDSVEQWNGLRAIRNQFAHDYPEDNIVKAAYLNQAVEAVDTLSQLLQRTADMTSRLQNKG